MVAKASAGSEHDDLPRRALFVIRHRAVSTKGLAAALGVSTATAARAIAALRKSGVTVRSVRGRSGWFYELADDAAERRRRWRASRLRRLAGFIVGPNRRAGKLEDAQIYARD